MAANQRCGRERGYLLSDAGNGRHHAMAARPSVRIERCLWADRACSQQQKLRNEVLKPKLTAHCTWNFINKGSFANVFLKLKFCYKCTRLLLLQIYILGIIYTDIVKSTLARITTGPGLIKVNRILQRRQGTILGPKWFLVQINDLKQHLPLYKICLQLHCFRNV